MRLIIVRHDTIDAALTGAASAQPAAWFEIGVDRTGPAGVRINLVENQPEGKCHDRDNTVHYRSRSQL